MASVAEAIYFHGTSYTSIYITEHATFFIFFFFKQKTAYEIMPSLVGSEMCIRDRVLLVKKVKKEKQKGKILYHFNELNNFW